MTEPTKQIPIIFRCDFYDVPRFFVVYRAGVRFAFDCPFDATADEYPSHYTVSRLASDLELDRGRPDTIASGVALGVVRVTDVTFSPDRRSWIDGSVLDRFLATWTAVDDGHEEYYAHFYRIENADGELIALVFANEDGSAGPRLDMMLAAPDLRAAGNRLLPPADLMAQHAGSPDGEPINLITTWGAVRQMAAALAKAAGTDNEGTG